MTQKARKNKCMQLFIAQICSKRAFDQDAYALANVDSAWHALAQYEDVLYLNDLHIYVSFHVDLTLSECCALSPSISSLF